MAQLGNTNVYGSLAATGNITANALSVTGNITANVITGSEVWGAVWNDLADCITVPEDTKLEWGKCYCFDGEKYYQSTKYLDDGVIGIHSDTYGFAMGKEEDKTKLDIAVAGFVLAYVDDDYPVGTPLVCGENGFLTKLREEDFILNSYKIVATYWKSELADEWGSDKKKVKVNGRKWVKIK